MVFTSGTSLEWTCEELKATFRDIACLEHPREGVLWDLRTCEANVDWEAGLHVEKARRHLNALNAQVMQSDDKELVTLFRRAHRNFDSVYPANRDDTKLTPFTFYKRHYQEPAFKTPTIHVTLDVHDDHVLVTTDMQVAVHRGGDRVVLDGREHDVREVWVDGHKLSPAQYRATEHELVLLEPPARDTFNVKVLSSIDPFNNDSMEGLYLCDGALVSQCESEAARRIFFTVDEPNNRSVITTTIIADPGKYPTRISNGNLVEEKILEDGRSVITWHDPHTKPSYIFAVVLGKYDFCEDVFVTRSGREVTLQVFVEPGKKERAYYSLWALKKSMEYDEEFFDREYDLDYLKMVGVSDFNAGAMENKGLMIFNDTCLLVDSKSGTDRDFMNVAHTVMHEYAHNWTGNRVTVKYFYEAALKEAFTDFRSQLFMEWMFGADMVRPSDVRVLQNSQFPEDASKDKAHPINGDSYIESGELYDATTYIKGREVFRTLKTILDAGGPDEFRKAQNLYFERHDGASVTFNELAAAMEDSSGRDLTIYRRWLDQPGTPLVNVKTHFNPDQQSYQIEFKQSCPDPRDGKEQKAFHIPMGIELIARDGRILIPKETLDFTIDQMTLTYTGIEEQPTPVLLHAYSAPIRMKVDYSIEDLTNIIQYANDAYCRSEACQELQKRLMNEVRKDAGYQIDASVLNTMSSILMSDEISALVKANLLSLPNTRSMLDGEEVYDFAAIKVARKTLKRQLAKALAPALSHLADTVCPSNEYDPHSPLFLDDIHQRALRSVVLGYCLELEEDLTTMILETLYRDADNFTDKMTALRLLANGEHPAGARVLRHFADEWKDDKAVFNNWLSIQAGCDRASPELMEELRSHPGYDSRNPNHIRSVGRGFISNMSQFHDPSGSGYKYIVDLILEVEKFNPYLARGYFCEPAFIDYAHLPTGQRALLRAQIQRLADEAQAAEVRATAVRVLERNPES